MGSKARPLRATMLLFWAVALVATPAQAQIFARPSADAPGPIHSLPFELYDGRIYIQASGSGFGPGTFMLDTGAQITHFTSELVREARLATFGSSGITGTGEGRVDAVSVAATALDLGGFQLPIRNAVAAPANEAFGPVYTGSGKRFDGVIGYDLFAAFAVEIDYERRLIRLYGPAAFRHPEGADIVPIRLIDRKPYLAATFSLGGQSLAGDFLIDTGSGGAIGFNGDFVVEKGLVTLAGKTLPTVSRGIGGATPARLARVQSLTIGRTILPEPLAIIALEQGKGVRSDAAGRIGGALLRRFTVTVHYAGQTVGLRQNSNFGRPLETDMSGLAFISRDGEVVVERVEEGSAASDAGMQAGDRLLAIGRRAAPAMSLERIRGMLMQEGESRALRVLRQGAESTFFVKLKRRI